MNVSETAASEADKGRETLWKQYEIQIDLYKHHTELLLKFTIYYYAITGALTSYYLSQPRHPFRAISLLFPLMVSFLYGLIFIYSARAVESDLDEIADLSRSLGLKRWTGMYLLPLALKVSGLLFLVTCFGLLALAIIAIGVSFSHPNLSNQGSPSN
jgi:hypothetical protein